MRGLDAWLEKPYVDAARRDAAYEAFCERNGYDPDDSASEEAFEDHQEFLSEPDPDEARERQIERELEDRDERDHEQWERFVDKI